MKSNGRSMRWLSDAEGNRGQNVGSRSAESALADAGNADSGRLYYLIDMVRDSSERR